MKRIYFAIALALAVVNTYAQQPAFTIEKNNPATSVKNQGRSGTCWCFSSTALVESEVLFKKHQETDLSETFTIYNLFLDKAEKYIRRRGDTRFSEGGIEQDMLYAVDNYGAVPQSIYPGVGKEMDISKEAPLQAEVKVYLDRLLKNNPDTIPSGWEDSVKIILNAVIGTPPDTFSYDGKDYTPKTYAAENVQVKLSDYIGLTSFTHHPYYTSFAMEVPDNYNSNMFYNLPLDEFMVTLKRAIMNGYTIAWDADVSNKGFRQRNGIAKWVNSPEDGNSFLTFTEKTPMLPSAKNYSTARLRRTIT